MKDLAVQAAPHSVYLATVPLPSTSGTLVSNISPAYLESTNPRRNIPFYENFSFERVGMISASTSPQIVPKVREAQ
jgi:hypothetical protein